MCKELMMKFVFIFTVLFFFALTIDVASQTNNKADEINQFVEQLSWDSTSLNYDVLISILPKDEAAKRLIEIGKPATDALLKVLTNENKALAAHILLTTIWERPIIYVVSNAIYKKNLFGKKFVAYSQDCNGLKWTTFKDGKRQIDSGSLIENASKWLKKIDNYRLRDSS